MRSNAEKKFDSIFIKVVEMANNCGTTIQIKRRCQQQANNENYQGEHKDFYRNSIFIPYLDNLISQLESRFHQINLSAMRALHLIPKNLDSLTREFQTDILHIMVKNCKILIALNRKFDCGNAFGASQRSYHQPLTKL